MNPNQVKLRILSMNCNSIIGKLNEIKCYAQTLDPDLISITETKIGPNIDDNELLGDKYTIWRNDRDLNGGGVLIALKNDTEYKVLDCKYGPGEAITLQIQLHPKIKFNIITFYRPPSEYTLDNLIEIIDTNNTDNCLYIGDYNLPDIDWQSDPGKGKIKSDSTRKAQHQLALNTIVEADLKQLVSTPTHRLGNTLDLVMTNKTFLNEVDLQCEILPPISDHNMILIDMKTQHINNTTLNTTTTFKNYNKAKYDEIEQIFSSLASELEAENSETDSKWRNFKVGVNEALDSIPGKLAKPRGQPWINRNIVRMIRKKCRLYNRNKNFPSIAHQDELDSLCKLLKQNIKDAKADYLKNHLTNQMEEGNTKPLYNYLNKHSGRSNCITSLTNSEPHEIPDELAAHFASVFEDQALPCPDHIHVDAETYPTMEEISIGRQGVELLLTKLDQRKAPGPDNIPAIAIKNFAKHCPSFIDCVGTIFRSSLKEGKVPHDWKTAVIKPIYKGGNRTDRNNYRPISLTSILAKTMEHIICSRMWQHINNTEILKTNQHGFRKYLNTTTQLLHVIHRAAEAHDSKKENHLISFDFSKAFDKVPHNLLIFKLKKYNFDNKCIDWIGDWLLGRSSVVSVNGMTSSQFSVKSGVPQGSVLGPLLFILYVSDIADKITNSDCRLYADDTVLCSSHPDPQAIQADINELFEWANTWGMKFNQLKCCHIQIGKDTPATRFNLGREQIPVSKSVKYLGVHINTNLKWNTHVSKITAKANRTLGILKRNLKGAPKKTKLLAFNSMVKPILEYASQVWSPHTIGLSNILEKVQNNALRWIFWLNKRDSITECRERNEILSLSDRRDELDTLFLRKVEAGLYNIQLNEYIKFKPELHNTRGNTLSHQHRTNVWRYSFYNRIKAQVKVYFPPSDNPTN